MSFDRTASMGLYSDDPRCVHTHARPAEQLQELALNVGATRRDRDAAIWLLAHQGTQEARTDLKLIACREGDIAVRRSASWALFKLLSAASDGESADAVVALEEVASAESPLNHKAWNSHLLAEARGETAPHPIAPARRIEGMPFDVSIPISVEGKIRFRDGGGAWHLVSIGGEDGKALIGDLVIYLRAETIFSSLMVQRTIPWMSWMDPRDWSKPGQDIVDGYRFNGLSRSLSDAAMVHHYDLVSPSRFHLSGRVADPSQGFVENETGSLSCTAETNISTDGSGPYPTSVRGAFFGLVFAQEDAMLDEKATKDGAVQFVSTTNPAVVDHMNGIFFGSFRGIPIDVDDDGTVEINGIPPNVDAKGNPKENIPLW
jgi:hypothetical protein